MNHSFYRKPLFIVLIILVLVTNNVYAGGIAPENNDWTQIESVINDYSFEKNSKYCIVESVPIHGFIDDSCQYTLYKLSPYGYAIFYNATNSFMEGCYMSNTFADNIDTTTHFYYGGPGNYYILTNGKYISVIDGNVLSDTEIVLLKQTETRIHYIEQNSIKPFTIPTKSSDYNLITQTVANSYFSTLDKFGNNTNGTCTVLAEAILLGYYDVYVNGSYIVDSLYRDGYGTNEALHQLLCSYVYGSGAQGAIKIRNTKTQINSYISSRGLSTHLHSVYSSQNAAITKAIEKLADGKPVIASMATTYGASINHTVLVYGVTYNQPVGATGIIYSGGGAFKTHYGWHGSSYYAVSVSCSWFYECGYIQ